MQSPVSAALEEERASNTGVRAMLAGAGGLM
jgi:hypothetical protein